MLYRVLIDLFGVDGEGGVDAAHVAGPDGKENSKHEKAESKPSGEFFHHIGRCGAEYRLGWIATK